jgi:hypothetical protein
MTEHPNPSVRSRQVSNQLRQLREELGMSASKISRMETGAAA